MKATNTYKSVRDKLMDIQKNGSVHGSLVLNNKSPWLSQGLFLFSLQTGMLQMLHIGRGEVFLATLQVFLSLMQALS